ncbi:Hydrogenase-3 nickel incorporation protein HypA [Epsilonproteobacteria bacterium SCGC AD-311-C15]|jgi:hydrogenase nickel incorporation protein HypA/HybF|nr:Hydrogenase-3 nickel incorporation protein HypA [Epsilonproteobacteria bacterium SCGC AD-311-C15]
MHEYSIVQSLLDSCDENAVKNNATKVTKVVVKIGVMSGVEAELLKTAFDTFKEETICHEAEFIINIQQVVIKCHNCSKESTLKELEYCCPECQSTELDILDGEDMFLMSLEME